jgi:hypothetical protein
MALAMVVFPAPDKPVSHTTINLSQKKSPTLGSEYPANSCSLLFVIKQYRNQSDHQTTNTPSYFGRFL